jgi:hypothetical protein
MTTASERNVDYGEKPQRRLRSARRGGCLIRLAIIGVFRSAGRLDPAMLGAVVLGFDDWRWNDLNWASCQSFPVGALLPTSGRVISG